MIQYYVYKIKFADGMYYIGRHKFKSVKYIPHMTPMNDGYWGSGTKLKCKVIELWKEYWTNQNEPPSDDMTTFLSNCEHQFSTACLNAHKLGMTKEIIAIFDHAGQCDELEDELVKKHIGDTLCINLRRGLS